jgi:uncharacterized protein (DUF1786 family)
MSKYLFIDIGAGTMDILHYDTRSDIYCKAVARSPVRSVAEKAASLPGDLLVVGTEMGGGNLAQVLRERTRVSKVVMSLSASATVNHDPEKVRSWSIQVVEDNEAEELRTQGGFSTLTLEDLDLARIRQIVEGLDVPFAFDAVAVCAQDHGVPPSGVSHLDYRHEIFKKSLEKNPSPHTLLYRANEIPPTFSRLKAISQTARSMAADEVFLMDSGMAAILGASLDPLAEGRERILTLDLATSHTVGALLDQGEIAGLFEYHTRDITLEKVDRLIHGLAEGLLEHKTILREGGHGAYIRKRVGLERVEVMVATGPRRSLVGGSRFPLVRGSPLGDNMMTGTVGLLEALRRKEGLAPFPKV